MEVFMMPMNPLKILIVTVAVTIGYIREEMRRAVEALKTGGHVVDWLILTEQLEDSELYTHSQWTVGKTLSHNHEKARRFALENGYDHIFLLESDIAPPPHALLSLLDVGGDIVSAVGAERPSKIPTLKPGEPNLQVYHVFGGDYTRIREKVRAGKPFILEGSVEGEGNTGRAHLLLSRRALQHPFHASDGAYCHQMRERGFDIWVDPRVACSHVDRDGSIIEPVF